MTQTPSRDWQKDMEMCKAATPGPWKARSWTVPTADQYNITSEHDATEIFTAWQGTRYPGGPEVSADQAKLNAIFAAEARTALTYWLQEAKRLKEESSEAVEGLYQLIQRGDLTSYDLAQADQVRYMYITALSPEPSEPAPKIHEYGVVTHPEYGRGWVVQIIGTSARIVFDDLDYDLTLEITELTPALKEGDAE